jgi:hypothetical protein
MTDERKALVEGLRMADCKLDGRKLENYADALCKQAADQIEADGKRIADLTADAIIVDRMRDRLSDLEGFEDGGITSAMWDELCALRRWLGERKSNHD